MTSPSRTLLSLLAAGTVLTATAGPAIADSTRLKDARGDVWGASDASTATPAPTVAEGDITNAVITYSGSTAKVRIRLAKLRPKGPYAQYAVVLQGKQGKVVRQVLVETGKRERSGTHRVFNAAGSEVDCRATHKISYGRDQVTVTLQRDCLGSPHAVRANINTAHATGGRIFYSDNAHDTAAESAAWSEWVRRS